MEQLESIKAMLKNIDNGGHYTRYTTFVLQEPVYLDNRIIQEFLYYFKQNPKIKIQYNNITKCCDTIGVVDIGDIRYFDFDDEEWTMSNKGLDCSTDKTILD